LIGTEISIGIYILLRKYCGLKVKFMEQLLQKVEGEWKKRKAIRLAIMLRLLTLPKNKNFEGGREK